MASSTIEYHEGLDYGIGVDTPSGETRNVAVTGTPSSIPQTPGGTISFSMTQVSSMEELTTALGISASASGSCGLFGASARFKFAQDCHINTQSVFICVSVEVTQAFEQIKAPGVTGAAAALLANGDTTSFQNQFGDMFVGGLSRGGYFFGVVEIFTQTETDKQQIAADVQGSYVTAQAEVSFDQSFQKTTQNHYSKVYCHIEGGDPNLLLPDTVNDMMTRALGFPKENINWPVAYSALLHSYSILPLPSPPNFVDLQHQKDVLTQCAVLRNLDLELLNNINYIEKKPDQFVDVTNTAMYPLDQWRQKLSADLDAIAAAASFALDHPKDAKMPENLQVNGPIVLPARKAGSVVPQVQVPNVVYQTAEQAHISLAAVSAQFKVQDVQKPMSVSIGADGDLIGKVVGQNPAADTKVNPDATITLVVGAEDTTTSRIEFNSLHHN